MSRRGSAIVVLVLMLALAGCTEQEPEDVTSAPPRGPAAVAGFCTGFPEQRAVGLELPERADLAGAPDVAAELMRWEADSVLRDHPAVLDSAVQVYAKALRSWEPGDSTEPDPATASAVSEIDSWLATNCGPPTTGGTSPGG